MPVISMTLGQGKMSSAQKKQFVQVITSQAAEITTMPESSFTVMIEELDTDNIGVGGETLTDKASRAASAS